MSYEAIATFTTSGNTTISNIPQDYDDLILYFQTENNRTAGPGRTEFRLNGDSGTNYSSAVAANWDGFLEHTRTSADLLNTNSDSSDNRGDTLIMHIPQYKSNHSKLIYVEKGFMGRDNNVVWGGYSIHKYITTSAINSISIFATSGTMTGFRATLYGRI